MYFLPPPRPSFNASSSSSGNQFLTYYCLFLVFAAGVAICLCIIAIQSRCRAAETRTRSRFAGKKTGKPIIPFPQDHLQLFTGYSNFENRFPGAKILCEPQRNGERVKEALVIYYLDRIMEWVFDLYTTDPEEYRQYVRGRARYVMPKRRYVPMRARTISIKMQGFRHGAKCHDFVPNGGVSRDGYFAWQMFGEMRMQATFYVENGIACIAGFCIYIDLVEGTAENYDMNLIKGFFKYGRQRVQAIPNLPRAQTLCVESLSQHSNREELRIQYCGKLRRDIMSRTSSGVVIHQEWDNVQKRQVQWKCDVCVPQAPEDPPPPYSSLTMA